MKTAKVKGRGSEDSERDPQSHDKGSPAGLSADCSAETPQAGGVARRVQNPEGKDCSPLNLQARLSFRRKEFSHKQKLTRPVPQERLKGLLCAKGVPGGPQP